MLYDLKHPMVPPVALPRGLARACVYAWTFRATRDTSARLAPRREDVGLARRQQADAGRCETELHVVGAVQFPCAHLRYFRGPRAASARVAVGGVPRHWFVCLPELRASRLKPSVSRGKLGSVLKDTRAQPARDKKRSRAAHALERGEKLSKRVHSS